MLYPRVKISLEKAFEKWVILYGTLVKLQRGEVMILLVNKITINSI